jgi:hypothetical protein
MTKKINESKKMNQTRQIQKSKKTRKNKKSIQSRKSRKSLKTSTTLTSLLDFKKNKSLTILSKPSDIKSITSVGEFYNLLDIHDNINKNCINKVKNKNIDGIQLNKNIAKTICSCLFEKNKDLTIEKLESDTNKKIQTPGSSCIYFLDNFIKEEKGKTIKSNKSNKSNKTNNSSKTNKSNKSNKSKVSNTQ